MAIRGIRRVSTVTSAIGLLVAGLLAVAIAHSGPASATAPAGVFTSLRPARVLDTRIGLGATTAPANGTLKVIVAGQGGLPASGVAAVVLNVTVTQPSAAGYLSVWGDGSAQPTTSNLNFSAKQTVANLVLAPVGADGKVDLLNGSTGSTQVIADVSGYYSTGSPTAPGAFGALSPARILDTRSALGATAATAGATLKVAVEGRGGVPASGVAAVVLNVTVTQPTAAGYVTVWGDGSAQPATSNLNFGARQTVPNLVVTPVGADGQIELFNGSLGTTQLIADVAGYFLTGTPTAAGTFTAISPARVLDTRIGSGGTVVGAHGILPVQVSGVGGVPESGISAVVLNLTVTQPGTAGYITAWGDGTEQTPTSNLNFLPGQTVPNLVLAPVGADGAVDLFNGSPGSVQLIADVAGYVLANGLTTTLPTWGAATAIAGDPSAVSCVSTTFCVAVGAGAVVYRSGSWSTATQVTPPGSQLVAVSCATTTFCAAVSWDGLATTFNGTSWSTPVTIDAGSVSGAYLTTVSCPTPSLCIAADLAGYVMQFNGTAWGAPQRVDTYTGGPDFNSFVVDCPTSVFCEGAGGSTEALSFNGTAWTTPVYILPHADLRDIEIVAIDCTGTAFCVAVDSEYVFVYNGTGWSRDLTVDPGGKTLMGGGLEDVSCSSATFCAATTFDGQATFYNGVEWTTLTTPADGTGRAVSCVSPTFCMSVDGTSAWKAS